MNKLKEIIKLIDNVYLETPYIGKYSFHLRFSSTRLNYFKYQSEIWDLCKYENIKRIFI